MDIILIVLCSLILILLVFILVLLKKPKSDDKDLQLQMQSLLHSMQELEYQSQESLNQKFNQFTDRMDQRITGLDQRNSQFEKATATNLVQFQDKLNQTMNQQFTSLQETVERRLLLMDQKVNQNLEDGFKKTNETFTNIVSRLSKIDEAQKKIDALSTDIISLQDILTDKKTRGAFGEIQLHQIFASIFGDRNDKVYQLQYSFDTGVRSDAVLFAPEPLGTIAIDSKFPLENYQRMVDTPPNSAENLQAKRMFVQDCKKHIDAISQKYIIPGVTSDQAIMFVPAEAVFATIHAYHPEIITYSQQKRVWIVSPTTLMSTLTTIQTILINMERDKYAAIIQQELKQLGVEFTRYKERWSALERRMDGIHEDFKKINITSDKITKRFDAISNVDLDTQQSISIDDSEN